MATIAALLDFRKHFDASLVARLGPPVIDIPGGVHANASTITLRVGTTHLQPDMGLATALDMMLGLDGAQPAVGLIGARASVVSMPVATLASVQKVPQISFGSTSPALSNKAAYPFFLRTAAPDTIQAFALWEWIVQADIPMVTCLYSMEGFGQGLMQEIQKRSQQAGQPDRIKGKSLRYMPQDFDAAEVRETVGGLRDLGSNFVILAVEPRMASQILPVLEDEGMLGEGWQLVGTDTYADVTLPLGFMTFLPSAMGSRFPDFQRLWSRIEEEDILSTEARQEYSLDRMKAPLDHASVQSVIGDVAKISTWTVLAFDAVYTFLVAINQLLQKGVPQSAIRSEVLLEELLKTQFVGASGQVSFDENGDRLGAYNLLNMQQLHRQAPQSVVAAVFSASTGNFTFQTDLVWMDGSRGLKAPQRLFLCESGFYQAESRQCRVCPRGSMCAGGNASFVLCPRGTFAGSTGMSTCTPCPEGQFAGDIGSFQCSPCIPGYVAARTGMEACTRCELGSYMPFPQGSACLICGGGQVTPESGADSQSQCLCDDETFMCNNVCKPCPHGLYCPKGLGPPLQMPGYWADPALFNGSESCEASVLHCRSKYECPLAELGNCADGREGRACNNCKTDHFPVIEGTGTGSCQPCEGGDWIP